MKRICSVFVLLICIIQILVFIPNNNIYAIDSIEDEPEFIPLSPEKIKIIYDLVKNPRIHICQKYMTMITLWNHILII